MSFFNSVLIANRGEIAARVIKTAKSQGYRTIAVYSQADADSPHVSLADEAVFIGPAPVKESYLNIDKIIAAALRTDAGAIHPGYGFLSENPEFAEACAQANIVFIGPSARAIELMGNKAASKRLMLEAGVPCIPGYQDTDQSDETLIAASADIGFPIMVKAAAGGGGRGMRLVDNPSELQNAITAARSEALNAFGSDELILEKAVIEPRHVEVQVFGDSHGNIIHLGERDCSVQRRHQKVVEESPCQVMTETLRERMGLAAVAAAKSIDYCGAGTVEFLLDGQGNFYFLEMNTRLQVEHPVTEMVTGLDLVATQLNVAQGLPLEIQQSEVQLEGHAIEVRLYAEDTENSFLPATGKAELWSIAEGEGIRVDHGLNVGQEISPFYDPMVAKVIAWGRDRQVARRRLVNALKQTSLVGFETNREFLIDVLDNQVFSDGEATTAFIESQYPSGFTKPVTSHEHVLCAALLFFINKNSIALQGSHQELNGFSSGLSLNHTLNLKVGEKDITVSIEQKSVTDYQISLAESENKVRCITAPSITESQESIRVCIDGLQKTAKFGFINAHTLSIQIDGVESRVQLSMNNSGTDNAALGSGSVIAPMHGNVLAINVGVGDKVQAGDELAVLEAMKMEHRLYAEQDGTVAEVFVQMGDQIVKDSLVLTIDN